MLDTVTKPYRAEIQHTDRRADAERRAAELNAARGVRWVDDWRGFQITETQP